MPSSPGWLLRVDDDVELRLLAQGHAAELFQLTDRHRAHLREWLPWVDGTKSRADTESFIRRSEEEFEARTALHAGIWSDRGLVGVVGYHEIDTANRKAGIGYWLGAEFQGRGFMSRSCRALVAHGFTALDLNRIEISCATANAKSRAIPERLGFTLEGIERQAEWIHDRFVDLAVYSMLAGDWR